MYIDVIMVVNEIAEELTFEKEQILDNHLISSRRRPIKTILLTKNKIKGRKKRLFIQLESSNRRELSIIY
jgi:hypothetical protein